MPYCSECGVEVEDGQTYCRECGARLYEEDRPETEEPIGGPATEPDEPVDESRSDEDYDDEGLVSYAISYPGRSGFGTPLVGAIFLLLSFLILPFFIVGGYLVKLTEHAAKGRPKPPEDFGEWGDFLVYGLVAGFLVYLPFLIVLYIAFLVPFFLLADSSPTAGLLLGYAFEIPIAYFFPAVLVNYCVDQRLGDAYNPDKISSFALNSTYLLSHIIFFFLNLVLTLFAVVGFFLSLLTIVGWIIIIPLIYFYLLAVYATYWGRVYYKTVGAGA